MGMICRIEVVLKRRMVAQKRSASAEKISDRALRARGDQRSACVPEHEQRPRMWREVHAAHCSG